MKYTGGKSYFNNKTGEWEYSKRKYTDFYCNLIEWGNLGRGKPNFMYQLREHISKARPDLWNYKKEVYYDKNGNAIANKLSFDRTGRRDNLDSEIYSAQIIYETILHITHQKAKVEFYSWKGIIDHIEITFPNKAIPNIICIVDDYCSSTNETLIFCIDCIYQTLHNKTTQWYETKLEQYYNNNYDIVYMKKNSEHSSGEYYQWKDKWMWNDIIKPKANRIINKVNISYK